MTDTARCPPGEGGGARGRRDVLRRHENEGESPVRPRPRPSWPPISKWHSSLTLGRASNRCCYSIEICLVHGGHALTYLPCYFPLLARPLECIILPLHYIPAIEVGNGADLASNLHLHSWTWT